MRAMDGRAGTRSNARQTSLVRGDFGVLGPALDWTAGRMSTTHKNDPPLALACFLCSHQLAHRSFLSPPTCFIGLIGWVWVSLSLSLSCSVWYGGIARQPSQPPSLSIVSLCVHIIIALYTHPTPTASAYGRQYTSIACSSMVPQRLSVQYLCIPYLSACRPPSI